MLHIQVWNGYSDLQVQAPSLKITDYPSHLQHILESPKVRSKGPHFTTVWNLKTEGLIPVAVCVDM